MQLAKSTKLTHQEAETIKRNVADIPLTVTQYSMVEKRLDECRSRLKMLLNDATKQNSRFDVIQTWCCGGGALTHQYVRRVMLKD